MNACIAGWTCADINGSSPAGGAVDNGNGTWNVSGGGDGIQGRADSFFYLYQTQGSGTTISAHLASYVASPFYTSAGLMMRDSTAPGAPYYYLYVLPNGGLGVKYRLYSGDVTTTITVDSTSTVPASLEIKRQGFMFTAYSNGSPISGTSIVIAMTGTLAGLAVTTGAGGLQTATVSVDSVTFTTGGGTPQAGCPGGWTCADIGSPPSAGFESTVNQTSFAVAGSGYVNAGTDSFHYDYQQLAASGAVQGQVESLTAAQLANNGSAQAGLMIRQSTQPGSVFYYAYLQPDGSINVLYRPGTGYKTILLQRIAGTGYPSLEVQRSGVTFTTYQWSGGSWQALSGSAIPLPMYGTVLAGPAVSAGGGTLTTAELDQVQVTPGDQSPIPQCPGPWTCQDVGTPGWPGDQGSASSTSWAVTGGGDDIGGGTDLFHYVYQRAGSYGAVSATVTWHTNVDPSYTKAGVMLRKSVDREDLYYYAYVDQNNNIHVDWRDTHNTYPKGASVISATLPVSVEVKQAGKTFSAFYRTNGGGWQPVPGSQATIDMGNALGGMAVTAGNNGTLATAGFDQVNLAQGGPTSAAVGSPTAYCPTCPAPVPVSVGDPVSTVTGALYETVADLSIPGRGMALDFAHSYSALNAAQDGPLGYGWTDSCNMYLTTDPSGNITLHEERGTAIPFPWNGATYQAPGWVLGTLVKNGDGTLTFTRFRADQQFVFQAPTQTAAGMLLKEVDRNGYTTSLSYANGTLTTVTDPAGRALTLAYNANGRLASVTDPAQRTVSFSYDAAGNLTDVIDVGGGHAHFTYDANHLPLTMQSPRQYPNGPVTSNVYDGSGRVIQQTDPLNRTTHIAYAANPDSSQTTTVTDPKGNVTTYTFLFNELQSITEGAGTPQAATWTFTHDPVTLAIASATDPLNHTSTYSYDAHGNRLTATDPLNRTWAATYDGLDDLTSVTDPTNVTTSYTYDGKGNLLTVSRPVTGTSQTATTTLTYGDASHPGDVTGVTDPNNHTTSIQYDSSGDVTRVADPLGNATTYGYDAAGRVTSVVSPKGNLAGATAASFTTRYTYDAYGDVLTVTDPLGNQTAATYDANGNVLTVTDALNYTTTYTYDNADQLTQITQPDSTSTTTGYDADGNVASQTNGLGKTTSYGYDPLNRVVSVTDPLNRTTSYTYDAAGRLITIIDPMNRTTTFGYDNAGELTSVGYGDGVTPNVSFTYTADGQRATMADGTGTSQYSYDSLYRLTRSQNGAGKAVQYGYDLAGNLTSLTYPDNTQVTRSYDGAGELTRLTDWLGQTTTFTYDPDGNLTGEAFPSGTNGAKVTAAYDDADQLTRLVAQRPSGPGAFRWVFGSGRDPLGQLSVASDRVTGARHQYSYDPLGRLTQDQRSNRSTASWAYDAADQLKTTQDTGSGVSTTLGYDNAGQLSSFQKTVSGTTTQSLSFGYNADGDRTGQTDSVSGVQTTYGYDQADRLTSWARGSTTASYAYDGDGLRQSKTVNGVAEPFVYDLAEGLPTILQDGTTKYLTGPGGLPLEQVTGGGAVAYYVQDQLGSTRGLLDGAGNVAATYTYDPYGGLKGSTGAATTPFGYAGQYTDSESGFQYLRARYYDPSTQQFLTVDPLVSVTGEPYAYTAGDPLNLSDPTGLGCSGFDPGCWGGIAGGWLAGHAQSAARGVAVWGLNSAVDLINIVGTNESSGNPARMVGAFGFVYLNVFLGIADVPGEVGLVALSEEGESAADGCLYGTNVRGQVTSRGTFRTGTIRDAWERASEGPTGGRRCPTCGREVNVPPGAGPRDWHVNHDPPWTRRSFPPDITRADVIENYQQGVNLECPSCNMSRGNRVP